MSKSGVPVVSQGAQLVGNVTNAFGDVLSGKNVFESVGKALVAPVAANVDLINDVTFGKLEGAPLEVGNLLKSGSDLSENIDSKEAAFQFVKSGAIVGGTALGAAYGAPLLEGAGITGTAATATAGFASNKILSGGNVLDTVSGLAAPYLPDLGLPDIGIDPRSIFGNIGIGSGPVNAIAPKVYTNPAINAPITSPSGGGGGFVALLLMVAITIYFVAGRK